ncbi:hypothetical protein FRC05_008619 [Tulasnella sp. 425]|nr:hypothetical protein FRC05_008619 [Tulasnella sp. 425]
MIPEPRPWASLPSFAEGRATVSGPHLLSDRSIEKRLRRKNVDLSAVLEAVRGQGRRAENGKKTMAQLLRQVDYEVIPYGGNTTQPIDSKLVSSLLSNVQVAINNVTAQLEQVAGQPWDAIGGGADPDTAEYSLADLAISAVKAVAPASAITDKYPELQQSVDAVTDSVTNIGPVAQKINWNHVWGWVLIGVGEVLKAIGTLLL